MPPKSKAKKKTKESNPDSESTAENIGTETSDDSLANDDQVRRSSRKRTVSKWLEGMHTSFGSPKARKLSDNKDAYEEDASFKPVPKKEKRASSPRARVSASAKSASVSQPRAPESVAKEVESVRSTVILPKSVSSPARDVHGTTEKELEEYLTCETTSGDHSTEDGVAGKSVTESKTCLVESGGKNVVIVPVMGPNPSAELSHQNLPAATSSAALQILSTTPANVMTSVSQGQVAVIAVTSTSGVTLPKPAVTNTVTSATPTVMSPVLSSAAVSTVSKPVSLRSMSVKNPNSTDFKTVTPSTPTTTVTKSSSTVNTLKVTPRMMSPFSESTPAMAEPPILKCKSPLTGASLESKIPVTGIVSRPTSNVMSAVQDPGLDEAKLTEGGAGHFGETKLKAGPPDFDERDVLLTPASDEDHVVGSVTLVPKTQMPVMSDVTATSLSGAAALTPENLFEIVQLPEKQEKDVHIEIINTGMSPTKSSGGVHQETLPGNPKSSKASISAEFETASHNTIMKTPSGGGVIPTNPSGLTILTAAATADILHQGVDSDDYVGISSAQQGVNVPSAQTHLHPTGVSSQGSTVNDSVTCLNSTPGDAEQITEQALTILQRVQETPSNTGWQTLVIQTDSDSQQELIFQPSTSQQSGESEDVEHGSQVTSENMNLPTAGKKLVVETINIDELPEEVASAIKNYTAASSGSGGVEETGEKVQIISVAKEAGESLVGKNMPQKADFAYPTLLYDTEGNCLRIADQLEWPEGGSLLKCSNCDYITDKRANWYKHKRIHEGSRSYCCSVCDYKATTSSNLKRHMMSHTGVRTFVCSVTGCNARFFQKIHLQRHIKYRHMVKQVRCQLCDYTCALENPDLKIHMLRKHVPKKPPPKPEKTEFVYQCGECKFQTLVKKDLQQHMKFHSRGPELKLFCEQCSFVTDCQSRLNRHLLTHTKEKPFKCGVCEYRASQKEHVIRHMRTKHKLDVHKSKQVVTQLLREEELESFSAGDMVGSQGTSGEKLVEKELDTGTSHIVAKEDNQVENGKNVILTAQDVNGLQDEFLIVGDKVEVAGEGQESVDDVGGEHHTVEERKESWEYIQKATESDVNPRGEVTQTECLPSQHVSEEVVSNSPMVAIASDSDAGSELFINQQSDIEVVQSCDVRPTVRKETIYNKKKYAKADFSTLPKIFNCQYCTMKFAKLINLYKHIHVQHASVHPMPPEGTYACVVCDFKTPQKKALLVHMRRHNPEGDQDDRPNMIYSCVLCQYSTPKRRNLYWHLKKKHKISLLVNKDGTAKCVVEEDGPVVVVTAPTDDGAVDSDGQQVALSIQEKEGSSVHKVVNVSELAHSLIQPKVTSGGDSRDTAQPAIEVVVNDIKTEEDEDAAVAIEGLQALAEQMIQTPTEVVVSPADETEIDTDEKNIQLSSEQIMQLSSGDYIEIDGEMYKVELTPEEGSEITIKANTVQDC